MDFRNAVIIMTSNIGSQHILEQSATDGASPDGRAEVEAAVMQELRRHFRPEFLNRVDDIIVFRPLGDGGAPADRGAPAPARWRGCWRSGRSRWR